MKRTNSKVLATLVTLTAGALFTACGSGGVSGSNSTVQPQDNSTPTPVVSGTPGTATLPFSFSVYGQAPTSATSSIITDNLLQVTLYADPASRNQGTPVYTNFAAYYNCATFKVSLMRKTGANYNNPNDQAGDTWAEAASVVSKPISVADTPGCKNSVASQSIDLSAAMGAGHGVMKVQVTAMQSDFYCALNNYCSQNYWKDSYCRSAYPWNMPTFFMCDMKDIYQYHTVNGHLDITINP